MVLQLFIVDRVHILSCLRLDAKIELHLCEKNASQTQSLSLEIVGTELRKEERRGTLAAPHRVLTHAWGQVPHKAGRRVEAGSGVNK